MGVLILTGHFGNFEVATSAGLATVDPAPTLAVVSGLYELFPDNDAVLRSLQGIAATVPVGGYLAYTGQPWHPQLEFIARALTSHRGGAAWVMRRRTQQEMDELVRLAGFDDEPPAAPAARGLRPRPGAPRPRRPLAWADTVVLGMREGEVTPDGVTFGPVSVERSVNET